MPTLNSAMRIPGLDRAFFMLGFTSPLKQDHRFKSTNTIQIKLNSFCTHSLTIVGGCGVSGSTK